MGPGRNDPCPCGSGKKYKRCCLPREERERELRERLEAFIVSPPFEDEVHRAADAFFGDLTIDEEDVGAVATFASYLQFDHRTSTGETFLDRFLASEGDRLGHEDRAILSDLGRGRWGVYEVREVRPGRGILLQDLLTGEALDVRDVRGSRALLRWEIVYARLIPGRGAWVGDGAFLRFEPALRQDVLKCLEALGVRRGDPRASVVLGKRCAEAYRALRALAERPPFDRLVTQEGDPAANCRVSYRVADPAAVVKALEARKDVFPAGIDEEDRLVFNWAVPEAALPEAAPPAGERTLQLTTYLVPVTSARRAPTSRDRLVNLADLRLSEDRLEIDALSEARLERARAWVEGLGLGLEFLASSVEALDLKVEPGKGAQTPGPRRRAGGTWPPPQPAHARALAAEFLQSWPDTPLAALDGLTPRQAAKSRDLRETLLQLLKELEHRSHQGIGILRPQDVRSLIRALGLSEDLEAGLSDEAVSPKGRPSRGRSRKPPPSPRSSTRRRGA